MSFKKIPWKFLITDYDFLHFFFLFIIFQRLKQQTQSQMFYGHQVCDLSLFSRWLITTIAIFLLLHQSWQPEIVLSEGRKVNFVTTSTFKKSCVHTTNLDFIPLQFFKMVEVEGGNFNSKERKLLCNNISPPLRINSSKGLACLEHKSEGALQILTSFRAASTAFI